MKKLFFTAIAMIAFSGVSMANTIEEKEEIVIVDDCQQNVIDYYESVMDEFCGSPACGGDNPKLLNALMSICNP